MRQFIVLGHETALDPDFTLNDLPGSAGRLDVLCRCVNSALLLSHGVRTDTQIHLALQDQYTIRIVGDDVQYLNPDERSTGALLKKALEKKEVTDASDEQLSTPGIYIKEQGFEGTLQQVDGTVIQLHEDGNPLVETELPDDPVFVLSDHTDFTEQEQNMLQEHADRRVSVSPEKLHADHAITVSHNILDTDGCTRY